MPADVRMATSDDIDRLVQVRFDYFAAENWEVSPEKHRMIETSLRRYYSNHLNTGFFAFFVEMGGELASVAFLAISEKPANLSFSTGRIGTVYNVLTYPGHRRKGYATGVMNALIREAEKQNLSYLELFASEAGKPLYQKLGFREPSRPDPHTEMRLPLL